MSSSPRLELLSNPGDQAEINLATENMRALLGGARPSTAIEADFVSLYSELLSACGFDEQRASAILDELTRVEPSQPRLSVVDEGETAQERS